MEVNDDLGVVAERGLELCRAGRWSDGLPLMMHAYQAQEGGRDFAGAFYSYLGLGLAQQKKKVREGLQLCEQAVKTEFYNPENFLNLARVHLLAGNRRQGMQAIDRGLRVDPSNPALLTLMHDSGIRRRPVLPRLSRDNPLNQLFGRVRHAVLGPVHGRGRKPR